MNEFTDALLKGKWQIRSLSYSNQIASKLCSAPAAIPYVAPTNQVFCSLHWKKIGKIRNVEEFNESATYTIPFRRLYETLWTPSSYMKNNLIYLLDNTFLIRWSKFCWRLTNKDTLASSLAKIPLATCPLLFDTGNFQHALSSSVNIFNTLWRMVMEVPF